jgi:hypothetical protein
MNGLGISPAARLTFSVAMLEDDVPYTQWEAPYDKHFGHGGIALGTAGARSRCRQTGS